MQLSKNILSGLVLNKEYARKVYPHIKPDYFESREEIYLFKMMKKYMVTYRAFPTLSSLKLELANCKDLTEKGFEDVDKLISEIFNLEFDYTVEYLVNTTEEWCKTRSIHNALCKAIEIQETNKGVEGIPDILRKALNVSFNQKCGFEIFSEKSIDERYKIYQEKILKYPTGLKRLDELTNGGFEIKALSIFFGGSGVGKSAAMVALGANMARDGANVLYVTLEMSEEKISQRFEANFTNEYINNISRLGEDDYKSSLKKAKTDTMGRIIVKGYSPAVLTNIGIEALLDELEIKENFKADVVIIDYINLMRSSRVTNENSYTTVKCICEEVRGLAMERDLCIVSATQATKEGNNSKLTDMDSTFVGESKGLMDTVDFLCAMIFNEELREQNIQIWKICKNRFSGFVNNRFKISVEHDKSKIYDCEEEGFMYGEDETKSKLEKEKKTRVKKKVEMKFKDAGLDEDIFG